MENFISSALEFISSADMYLYAIGGVLVSLAAVAKLTKTKKDDKYVQMAINGVNKLKNLLSSVKPKKAK